MEFRVHKCDDIAMHKRFASHVAVFSRVKLPTRGQLFMLTLRRHDCRTDSISYIIRGGTLMAEGDLYEATYCWSDRINWSFVATCGIGYFVSKCRASCVSVCGKLGRAWYPEQAVNSLLDLLKDRVAEWSDEPMSIDDWLGKHDLSVGDIKGAAGNEREFYEMLSENRDAFGEDYWQLVDLGIGPAAETKMHLLGVYYAMQRLGDGTGAWVPERCGPDDDDADAVVYVPEGVDPHNINFVPSLVRGTRPKWLFPVEASDEKAIGLAKGERRLRATHT